MSSKLAQQAEKLVLDYARWKGWRVLQVRRVYDGKARRWLTPFGADGKGFPDFLFVRPGRMVYAEVKTGKGKLTKEQRQWRDDIVGAGGEWYRLLPMAHWELGEEILA